jgi:hypothetical protein
MGGNKPEWGKTLPNWPWTSGTGMCTSFTIDADNQSTIDATYEEYKGAHRLARKVVTDNIPSTLADLGAI